jgi:hypothetical protein
MRPAIHHTLAVCAALALPPAAAAASYNRVYLVPAVKRCPGPATCVPRELESAYTFDSIVLRSPATRYLPVGKPSLFLEVRGVRDPAGNLVNGNLTLRLVQSRVSLPTLGTFPDDSPLTAVAPIPIPLKNGSNRKLPYKPDTQPPNGTIVNGGGLEVYDPDGKLLAVTGSRVRP